ncbi:MAG: nuclear transport factor 2 family protein [Pseudomonadota bacterium]
MKTLQTVLLASLFAFPVMAAAESFEEPSDAVSAYITAVKTGSGAHIEEAFADNAEIQYYNPEGEYLFYSRAEFAELVDSGSDWDAVIEITNMLRTGHAANATVEFTWGENEEHGYIDYLNLIHADGSWRITNKVAQYFARD